MQIAAMFNEDPALEISLPLSRPACAVQILVTVMEYLGNLLTVCTLLCLFPRSCHTAILEEQQEECFENRDYMVEPPKKEKFC